MKYKYLYVLIIFFIILSLPLPLVAQTYPIQVKLIIKSEDEVIGQDEVFEILEMEDYILIPLVSLSRWFDISLSYDREEEILNVIYGEKEKSVQIDLKYNIYYDFSEWSKEPPETIEGDFFVTKDLIEYLIDIKVEWFPRRQELILNYDYEKEEVSEKEIKTRPEITKLSPDIQGDNLSIGSLQYTIGYEHEYSDDDDNISKTINNDIIIHARAGDWTFSGQQEVNYDINTEEYEFDYPLLRAQNPENNRLIILGDKKFSLTDTFGRINLRGLYVQYPLQQISERRAYTTIKGEAQEGSTVYLYIGDRKFDEQYIYRGENQYIFKNVPLTTNRTNVFKVIIEDINGEQKEIIKEVAGSLDVFEEGTNEGIFAIGKYNKTNDIESLLEVGGLQIKYAPSNEASFYWELGAEKDLSEEEKEELIAGSIMRLALRPENRPIVFTGEWLVGNEDKLLQHGGKVNALYTRQNGYFETSYAYILPVVEENIDVEAGENFLTRYENELNNNWLLDIAYENKKSILNMDKYDFNSVNLTFDYTEGYRNKFTFSTEVSNKEEDVNWKYYDLTEQKRNTLGITMEGRNYNPKTRLTGLAVYEVSDISFKEEDLDKPLKQDVHTELDLRLIRDLTDNLLLIGNYQSESNWLAGELYESKTDLGIRGRYKTGRYSSLTAEFSQEKETNRVSESSWDSDEEKEIELLFNHRTPRRLSFSAGIKNTYLKEESYLSGESNLNYNNPESDWELGLGYEYIAPYGDRINPQHIGEFMLSKELFSGLVGTLSFERSYSNSKSEEPIYEILVSFSQVLGFADGKVRGLEFERGEHQSYIAGVVYLDENGNKKKDAEEKLLENISVVNERYTTTTNKKGYFIFENVRPGLHEVGIKKDELSYSYKVVTDNKLIQIRENENIFIDFGLTMLGEIRGKVFLENQINKDISSENISLNNIGIIIDELDRTVFTKSDGTFLARDVPLGDYTIRIMKKSLPLNTKVVGEGVYKIKIEKDNLIKYENIYISEKN